MPGSVLHKLDPMNHRLDRHLQPLSLLFALLLASTMTSCASPPEDLATALIDVADGQRPVQPRLVGFGFSPCRLSDDFIPRGTCDADGALARRVQEVVLSSSVGAWNGEASERHAEDGRALYGRALYGWALALLLSAPDDQTLQGALLDMTGAADLAEEPQRQADRRSDVAAVQLLVAQSQQSPFHVATALDSALAALEIVPGHPEASFNRDLAMRWLGLIHTMDASVDDPWVNEQQQHWQPTAAPDDGCWDRGTLRSAIGQWSGEDGVAPPGWLAEQRRCWTTSEDRLFADLLDDLAQRPQAVAAGWRRMLDVRLGLVGPAAATVDDGLAKLRRSPIHSLRLSGLYFEVLRAYFANDYRTASRLNVQLMAEASGRSYLELEARAQRQEALHDEILGNFGSVSPRLQAAVALAQRADSPTHVAALRVLLIDAWVLRGRLRDAWLEISRALRSLVPGTYPKQRLIVLNSAGRLAADQDFGHLAAWLRDRAVVEARDIGSVEEVTALKTRGGFLANLGHPETARRDLQRARQILAEARLPESVRQTLELDLLQLEGQVAEHPRRRLEALEDSVEGYLRTEYNRQLVVAQGRLAKERLAQGQRDQARADLEAAFAELQQQVASFEHRGAAAPLVASGRALVGGLLALYLDDGDEACSLELLGSFLDLRNGRIDGLSLGRYGGRPDDTSVDATGRANVDADLQRLTYFVSDTEVLIFLQRGDDLRVMRSPVDRRQLVADRQRFFQQLEVGVEPSRLEATARSLAAALLSPVTGELESGRPLEIVADDVLAGLPFHLLPVLPAPASTPLLERYVVSYGTDLRRPEAPSRARGAVGPLLAIGFGASSTELPALPQAEEEARQVAALHGATPLLGGQASAAAVMAALPRAEAVHVAAHLVVDELQPMASYLALSGDGGRLTIGQLMRAKGEGLRLLYLSACEGGRSFNGASHGLSSLAQAFTDQGIEATVLSLWPLDDATGAEMALAFHRRLLDGASPAEALQAAQLALRDRHPQLWAGLVVYQ